MWYSAESQWSYCNPKQRYWLARLLLNALYWSEYFDGQWSNYWSIPRETLPENRPLRYYSLELSCWVSELLNFRKMTYCQRVECWSKILVAACRDEEYWGPPTLGLRSCMFALHAIPATFIGRDIFSAQQHRMHGVEVNEDCYLTRKMMLHYYQETIDSDYEADIDDLL